VKLNRAIEHLQGFRGAAEFLSQDMRFALQCWQGARINVQGAIEISQGSAEIFAGPAHAPSDPTLIIDWGSLAGFSAVCGGPNHVSGLLSGLRSDQVYTHIGSAEFDGASEVCDGFSG
jgi:hypothetical protein